MNKNKPTILIIEDEQLARKALRRELEKNNFTVISANNGQDGLITAFEKHPDLILLDIVLPVIDGMTVLSRLRDDSWGSKVPVIILSNLSKGVSEQEGKKMGVSTYLVKTDWKLHEVIEKICKEKIESFV